MWKTRPIESHSDWGGTEDIVHEFRWNSFEGFTHKDRKQTVFYWQIKARQQQVYFSWNITEVAWSVDDWDATVFQQDIDDIELCQL